MKSLEVFEVGAEAIGVAGMVAISYASTNLDNFLVLCAYSAKSAYRPFFVKLTFVLVCLAVVLISLGFARAAATLIADKLRYLGMIPIGIGLYHLSKLIFPRLGSESASPDEPPLSVGWALYLGFALTLLANSSDSVIVLAPIFADLRMVFLVVCASAAIAVALAMSLAASFVGSHPLLRAQIERFADWALPFLLIGIGVMILADKPSDAFVATGRSPGGLPIASTAPLTEADGNGQFH